MVCARIIYLGWHGLPVVPVGNDGCSELAVRVQ